MIAPYTGASGTQGSMNKARTTITITKKHQVMPKIARAWSG
jgi:hypothetical protein